MNWLLFVGINLISDSFRIFLDNYISDYYFKGRGSVSQKIFHGALQIIIALILLPFAGIDFNTVPFTTLAVFFLSGFLITLAGIPYFKALELDDSTNLGIFIQLAPILYLVFGWAFFGDSISPLQMLAFLIILAAPLFILLNTQKRSRRIRSRAILQAFIYVLITVVGNMIFIKQDTAAFGFIGEFALFYIGKGFGSLAIIGARTKWRRRLTTVVRRSPKKVTRLLITNTLIGTVADASYRLALALAPTMAIASVASDAVEPIVIFFMGIILTLIRPKFGREKLSCKSILVHLGATVLVVIGIVLIQT